MSMSIQVARNEFSGDPGLFGFLGKAVRKIGGRVLGATPVGAAIGTVGGFLAGRVRGRPRSLPGTGFPGAQNFQIPKKGIAGRIQRLLPGGETGFEPEAAAVGTQIACPQGFHANKSDYFTKAEGFIAEGTKCVRNRRRNPLNPGAASKAISRIAAAKRATRALGRITIRKEC